MTLFNSINEANTNCAAAAVRVRVPHKDAESASALSALAFEL